MDTYQTWLTFQCTTSCTVLYLRDVTILGAVTTFHAGSVVRIFLNTVLLFYYTMDINTFIDAEVYRLLTGHASNK